jgi:hypothetical protein
MKATPDADDVANGDDPFRELAIDESSFKPPPPLVRFEGWRAFVESERPERPVMPTPNEFAQLGEVERKNFALVRKRYHASFGPIETRWLKDVHAETLRLAALNFNAPPGARPGVVLNGLGTVGKSTIATALGRKYERSLRKRFNRPISGEAGPMYLPVVYVTLPGRLNIRSFDMLLAQFMGAPVSAKSTEQSLNETVVSTAIDCGVSLIIVDDVHFLRMSKDLAKDVNNHLKYLASSISATFVYAGIDLDSTSLLTEGRSKDKAIYSQTQHRFKKYDIEPFERGSEEFERLLGSFEEHILLVNQIAGGLKAMALYIHDRTGGFIGAVSNLLREGANQSITDGTETLTTTLLDGVQLDKGAEDHDALARPTQHKKRIDKRQGIKN